MSDLSKMADRLDELAKAVTRGREGCGEFTMRIPAEPDRDADLVLSRAARLFRAAVEFDAAMGDAEWEPPHPIFQMAASAPGLAPPPPYRRSW